MTVPQSSPVVKSETTLDEWIDYPERLIFEGDLREGADHLERVCWQAVNQRDTQALKRIADIANSSRDLSRRYQREFDRIHSEAQSNLVLIEGGEQTPIPRDGYLADIAAGTVALMALVAWFAWYIETDAGQGPGWLGDALVWSVPIVLVLVIGFAVGRWWTLVLGAPFPLALLSGLSFIALGLTHLEVVGIIALSFAPLTLLACGVFLRRHRHLVGLVRGPR